MWGQTPLRTVLEYFGAIAVILFAAVYLAGYIFNVDGWDERGWTVAAACSSVGASVIVLWVALGGLWAWRELRPFGLYAAILLGSAPIVRYGFDVAGWDATGWPFAAAFCGLGTLVWLAIPSTLLERLRIMPKLPPLALATKPRALRKMPQNLLDCSIRQDPSERLSLKPRCCSRYAR